MKHLYPYLLLLGLNLVTSLSSMSQSIEIVKTFEKASSSVLALYNDYFQKWENPQVDDNFPYAVIRVKINGRQEDILAAKKYFGLYLGQHSQVECKITDIESVLLFLVPARMGYVTLTCGEGCSQVQILSLHRLEPNAIYDGVVHYTPAEDVVPLEKNKPTIPDSILDSWYNIGKDYYYGENNKPQDYVQAAEWYRKSAEQGQCIAQCWLGFCYEFGLGVDKSLSEAMFWYQKSADQGFEFAKERIKNISSVPFPSSRTRVGNLYYHALGDGSSVELTYRDRRFYSTNYDLTKVRIPINIEYQGNNYSVKKVENGVFFNSYKIESITVEDGHPIYDSRENCNAVIETETNTLIAGCKNTIIPSSVTAIGDDAFTLCKGLTSITIPHGVTDIGVRAFSFCGYLETVIIPNSVKKINFAAFLNCQSLRIIQFNGTKQQWRKIEKGNDWKRDSPAKIIYTEK